MKDEELIEKVSRIADDIYDDGMCCQKLSLSDKAVEIIEFVRGSEWVSVEDELPEEHTQVLATQFMYMDKSKGRYQIISYRVKYEWFEDDSNDIPESVFTPTHWMPLPSPPTNKGDK